MCPVAFFQVHIKDVVALFAIVFKLAIDARGKHLQSSPFSRFVIASSYKTDFKSFASTLGKVLHERGLVDSPTSTSTTAEEAGSLAL